MARYRDAVLAGWLAVAAASCGGEEPLLPRVAALEGAISWNVEWDEAARGRGAADCGYRRTYRGAEDRSRPWLCPTCDTVFQAQARLEGADCHASISDAPSPAEEWLGIAGERWFRASLDNFPLTEQGTIRREGERLVQTYTSDWIPHEEGGAYRLHVSGELRSTTARADPYHGYGAPPESGCGWKRERAPEYRGRYRLEVGRSLPDGLFLDACGEGVPLRELTRGGFLVVEVAAADCGPCQEMADGEREFLVEMAERGVDVEVVTLLAPALDAVIDRTPADLLLAWTDVFRLRSPVLADRGWGYWVVGEALGERYAYPSIVIVSPDLEVVDVQTGYGGWDRVAGVIDSG